MYDRRSDSLELLIRIPTSTASVVTVPVKIACTLSITAPSVYHAESSPTRLRHPFGGHLQGLSEGLQLHRELNRVALYLALVVDLPFGALHVHRKGEGNVVAIHLAVFDGGLAKPGAVGFAHELMAIHLEDESCASRLRRARRRGRGSCPRPSQAPTRSRSPSAPSRRARGKRAAPVSRLWSRSRHARGR